MYSIRKHLLWIPCVKTCSKLKITQLASMKVGLQFWVHWLQPESMLSFTASKILLMALSSVLKFLETFFSIAFAQGNLEEVKAMPICSCSRLRLKVPSFLTEQLFQRPALLGLGPTKRQPKNRMIVALQGKIFPFHKWPQYCGSLLSKFLDTKTNQDYGQPGLLILTYLI